MELKNSIIGLLSFGGGRGERISGAQVILEAASGQERIAYQKTGDSGKVTFAHLDKGVYRILLDVPRQTGKLEVKEAWLGDMQVGYHRDKKLFLFQEASGYFSVRFSKLEYLANSNITPMFEPEENYPNNLVLIGKLEVVHKYGSLTLELAAHTQRKFQKLTDKYKDDAAMSVIRKSR